jgi:hypothetical protein
MLRARWTGGGRYDGATIRRLSCDGLMTRCTTVSNQLCCEAALTRAHIDRLRAGTLTSSWAIAVTMVVFNLGHDRCKQLLARGRRDL